jgi:outer membrane protein assembly factor BamD
MRKMFMFIISVSVLLGIIFLAGCGKKEVKPEEAYDPEKYLANADTMVGKKNYDEARKVLLEVKNRDSQKKYGALAQLKIADTYIKEGDPDLAITEYRKFIENYPDNQYASYAKYQIAIIEFKRLKQLYPRNPYRDIVELRIEKAENTIADGDFMIGEFYFNKESYKAAVDRLESLLTKYPDYKRADQTLLIIGKSYKALKINDKAKEVFNRLIEKYPASAAAKEATKLSPR